LEHNTKYAKDKILAIGNINLVQLKNTVFTVFAAQIYYNSLHATNTWMIIHKTSI